MEEEIKTTLRLLLFCFFAGALSMFGLRAVQWLIVEPETRIVVCMADELGSATVCKTLADMLKNQPK